MAGFFILKKPTTLISSLYLHKAVRMELLAVGGSEILLVMVAVLILFGSKKIPEVARGIGQGMREFKKATDDIKREINESAREVKDDLKDITKNLD
jgi:sec-independent protein translocase protein TatA